MRSSHSELGLPVLAREFFSLGFTSCFAMFSRPYFGFAFEREIFLSSQVSLISVYVSVVDVLV